MSQELLPGPALAAPEEEPVIPSSALPAPVSWLLRRSPTAVAAVFAALALWDIYQYEQVNEQQISLAPQIELATTFSPNHPSTLTPEERQRIFSYARKLDDDKQNLIEIFMAELMVGGTAALISCTLSYPENPQDQPQKING